MTDESRKIIHEFIGDNNDVEIDWNDVDKLKDADYIVIVSIRSDGMKLGLCKKCNMIGVFGEKIICKNCGNTKTRYNYKGKIV